MSVSYTWVQWNTHKKVYDLIAASGVAVYLGVFVGIGSIVWQGEHAISTEILVLRALGTCAFVLLNVILCIGPLCRLNRRFLPLLYNRRHLGVITFLIALLHATLTLVYYAGFGRLNPLVSLLTGNTRFDSFTAFPFELLGAAALLILFLLAATSHDFWLKNLSPRVWKGLHMMVYAAWGLLVMHIALGALQTERSAAYAVLVGISVLLVSGLHISAGLTARRRDRSQRSAHESDGWIEVCDVDDIPEKSARIVALDDGQRVAVFRYDGRVSAVSNTCVHQGGPLGEGRIVDGCITCPWHGYQYRPEDGRSPPPYTERIQTYPIRIHRRMIQIARAGDPPGTRIEPALIEPTISEPNHD